MTKIKTIDDLSVGDVAWDDSDGVYVRVTPCVHNRTYYALWHNDSGAAVPTVRTIDEGDQRCERCHV